MHEPVDIFAVGQPRDPVMPPPTDEEREILEEAKRIMLRPTEIVAVLFRQRSLEMHYSRLEADNVLLRAALEHYADARFWLHVPYLDRWARAYQPEQQGYGVARAALGAPDTRETTE